MTDFIFCFNIINMTRMAYKICVALILTSGWLFTGCATTRPSQNGGGAVGEIIRSSEPAPAQATNSGQAETKKSSPSSGGQNLEVWGQRLKNSRFDYPVLVNPAVENWISYFQGKGRKYFEKYLERGRYFIPEISKTLKAHSMPQDLVYLAMIESGFNNSAKSRARAVGPWQFIRPTGARYGLSINYWIDERRETKKATLAAIKYLKELYKEFNSWELAAAAYNAGENKVRRAIAKYRTTDFWEISKHRFFKRETRDYVPKIMAAAIITKNAEQFGFISPFGGKGFEMPSVVVLEDSKGAPTPEPTPKELGEEQAKEEDTSEDPVDAVEEKLASADLEDEEEEEEDPAVALKTGTPVMTPSVYMVSNPNERIIEFSIKGPADLFAISKAAELPYSTIKMLNPELLRWCTPPYMKTYRIKLPLSVKDKFLATYNDESFDRRVVFMRYTVKRGDNIQKLARRFGTETDPIRQLNNMSVKSTNIAPGSVIALPVPTGYKRVIASMYDDKPMPEGRKRRYRRYRRGKHRVERVDTSSVYVRERLRPNVGGG